ncbi:carbohydrate porin [Pseudoroseomonas wenyumeiae]
MGAEGRRVAAHWRLRRSTRRSGPLHYDRLRHSPRSEGTAPRQNGNYGIYAVGETILWRNGSANLAVFGRISVTPADRNPLTLYADGGFAWREPFGREGDTLSLGLAYARASADGRAQDRALGLPSAIARWWRS